MTDKIRGGFAVLFSRIKAADPAKSAHIRGFWYLCIFPHSVQRRKSEKMLHLKQAAHSYRCAPRTKLRQVFLST